MGPKTRKTLLRRVKDWLVCAYWDVTEFLLFGSVREKPLPVYGVMVSSYRFSDHPNCRCVPFTDPVRPADDYDPYVIEAGVIQAGPLEFARDAIVSGTIAVGPLPDFAVFADDGFTGDLEVDKLAERIDNEERLRRNAMARKRYWDAKAERLRKATKGKKKAKRKRRKR